MKMGLFSIISIPHSDMRTPCQTYFNTISQK